MAFFVLVLFCIAAFAVWIINLPLKVVHLWAISMTLAFVGAVVVTLIVWRYKR
jgi:hypothetical protein